MDYGPARPTLNDLTDARQATEMAGIDPSVSDEAFQRLLDAEQAVYAVWLAGPEAAHVRRDMEAEARG